MASPPIQPYESRRLVRPRRRQMRPAPAERRHRKLARRAVLVALFLLAIITGSLAGLTLVYSVDLPQIEPCPGHRGCRFSVSFFSLPPAKRVRMSDSSEEARRTRGRSPLRTSRDKRPLLVIPRTP